MCSFRTRWLSTALQSRWNAFRDRSVCASRHKYSKTSTRKSVTRRRYDVPARNSIKNITPRNTNMAVTPSITSSLSKWNSTFIIESYGRFIIYILLYFISTELFSKITKFRLDAYYYATRYLAGAWVICYFRKCLRNTIVVIISPELN